MLLVKKKIAEAENNLRELEKKFLYNISSEFRFVRPECDIPVDILTNILDYLGRKTACLNTEYYSMWIKTRGIKLTTKGFIDKNFNILLSDYVRCLEINSSFVEFLTKLYNTYNHNTDDTGYNLEEFPKLDTIEISQDPTLNTLSILNRDYKILKRVKKIIIYCTCEKHFECIKTIDSNKLDGTDIDRDILDKITFIHRSSKASVTIKDVQKNINLATLFEPRDFREFYKHIIEYNKGHTYRSFVYYHPVDLQYCREIIVPLYQSKGVVLELETIGRIERPIDYTPASI